MYQDVRVQVNAPTDQPQSLDDKLSEQNEYRSDVLVLAIRIVTPKFSQSQVMPKPTDQIHHRIPNPISITSTRK